MSTILTTVERGEIGCAVTTYRVAGLNIAEFATGGVREVTSKELHDTSAKSVEIVKKDVRAALALTTRALQTLDKAGRRDAGTEAASWHAVLVLSPSCDIVSKTGSDIPILAARVKDLGHRSGPQQAAVAAGWKPSDTGPRVAFASFAYVAAVPGSTRLHPAQPAHGRRLPRRRLAQLPGLERRRPHRRG